LHYFIGARQHRLSPLYAIARPSISVTVRRSHGRSVKTVEVEIMNKKAVLPQGNRAMP